MILSDEEIEQCAIASRGDSHAGCATRYARAIEAAVIDRLKQQEPVAWRFVDDEEVGYVCYKTSPPTPEQIAYLEKWNRPAWEPLYAHPIHK